MWREFVNSLSAECSFNPCADRESIAHAESSLGVQLPSELRDLMEESDGVLGKYSLGLVWPLERIVSANIEFRNSAGFKELYMPFAHLLFFGDAGNGDQFAFAILDGEVRRPDVYIWDHEDDSRTWVAPTLKTYLDWLLTGKLRV